MDVSILICTRNRAESLRHTLRSIAATRIPSSLSVELVVVDNGSSDETPSVIEEEAPTDLLSRSVVEPTPGASHARNAGIDATEGEVLLFTDDDVRVPEIWIEPMVAPILEGKTEAVAGGVRLVEKFRREWMSDLHLSLLADTTALKKREEARLVGANMAIARSVFTAISGFDPELGPGCRSLGLHEETLLTLQMRQADRQIATAYGVVVEHRPQSDRIRYAGYKQSAEKLGQSDAYLDHHWRHEDGQWIRSWMAWVVWSASLWIYRHFVRRFSQSEETMDMVELNLRRWIAYHLQMMRLIGTPRRYDRYGARRRSSESPSLKERQEVPLATTSGGALTPSSESFPSTSEAS